MVPSPGADAALVGGAEGMLSEKPQVFNLKSSILQTMVGIHPRDFKKCNLLFLGIWDSYNLFLQDF